MTLTTADGRIATIEVGYAFPGSPLKRHCSFMRIGDAGTATIWSDGSASFTAVDGATTTARIDVDSDPLYGRFVDKVAEQLEDGFADLPGIRDLEATMTVIWDAYANGRQGRPVSTSSIDEVAAAAGVHRSTVSRAFSRPEAVKQETRDHVLQVAASMGYTMSPLAQALRTKTSTLVPLIVPDIINPFFAELAKAMTAAARERGYQLVLCVTENDAGATAGYLRAMQSMYAPFAVLAPFASVDPDEFESFGFGRRLVVIDRVESNHQVPTVTVDSAKGIQLAFDHLLELGHTSIAYVSGIAGTHTAADRRQAYRTLAEKHGMTPIELDSSGIGVGAGERAAEELVSMLQRPTAVVAGNDMVAFGLISSLGSRGLSVPNDVSVVGFDGLVLGARSNPPLTSVQQPIAEMGRIAISLAERAAQNGHVEDVVLQPRLLVRSSTGPAR
jgi:DNA-binding LacI/PurR family transcriptional regulator